MLVLLWALGLFGQSTDAEPEDPEYPPLDPIEGDQVVDLLRVRRHRLSRNAGGR